MEVTPKFQKHKLRVNVRLSECGTKSHYKYIVARNSLWVYKRAEVFVFDSKNVEKDTEEIMRVEDMNTWCYHPF